MPFLLARYSNVYFSAFTNLISSIQISIENLLTSTRSFNCQLIVFLPCIRVLIIQKLQRKAFNLCFFILSLFKPMFPQSLRLRLFHQDRIQKLPSYKEFSNGKTLVCSFLHQSLGSPNFPKAAIFTARFPNAYFSATISCSFSSVKISMKTQKLVHEYSAEKSLFSFLASESW